jgi:hypothetical protein
MLNITESLHEQVCVNPSRAVRQASAAAKSRMNTPQRAKGAKSTPHGDKEKLAVQRASWFRAALVPTRHNSIRIERLGIGARLVR